MLSIKAGFGYWDTTLFPIGGSFHRVVLAMPIQTILRTFPRCHGADTEGITVSGLKVCFAMENTENIT